MNKQLEALIARAKHIVENGGLLARDTSLQLIEALEQANCERNIAYRQASAARNAFDEQYQLRDAAEKRIAELEASQTVSFYRDGIDAAANYIDNKRESFDNEHGSSDPDTGSFEFGNQSALEYSGTLRS